MTEKKHILSILVENKPGVLSRITGLFSGRGYNIESISASETTEPNVTRICMVTYGNEPVLEQIKKQLYKLINVIKVSDLTHIDTVQRELTLIKVKACRPENRAEILRIVDIFRLKVVDVGQEHYTIQATADEAKLDAIFSLLKPMGIKDVARTGIIAIPREPK